jgi:hypothetical protein
MFLSKDHFVASTEVLSYIIKYENDNLYIIKFQ